MLTLGEHFLFTGRTILIAPLDWGLGHSTRCVPIIRKLLKNNIVFLGVTEVNADFYKNIFPELKQIEVPSYQISYSKNWPVWSKMLFSSPKIFSIIREEEKQLAEILSAHRIDTVISDNRFGLRNKEVESVFITHQLKIYSPVFSALANKINKWFIEKFDAVWVPDYEEEHLKLAGELSNSDGIKIPVKYIGPQSQLVPETTANKGSREYDILILLSGPEPQRSLLEELLIKKLDVFELKTVLIRGSKKLNPLHVNYIKVIEFANADLITSLVGKSRTVICRSGYSTLMDMHLLKKKVLILIPTPGQTEQEYLAKYWQKKFKSGRLLQKEVLNYNFTALKN